MRHVGAPRQQPDADGAASVLAPTEPEKVENCFAKESEEHRGQRNPSLPAPMAWRTSKRCPQPSQAYS